MRQPATHAAVGKWLWDGMQQEMVVAGQAHRLHPLVEVDVGGELQQPQRYVKSPELSTPACAVALIGEVVDAGDVVEPGPCHLAHRHCGKRVM